MVLQNNHLTFYKDQRHRQENVSYHGEQPIDLIGCSSTISEYPKRKNVLSLRMPYGSEFLLQANDEVRDFLGLCIFFASLNQRDTTYQEFWIFRFENANLYFLLGRPQSLAKPTTTLHRPIRGIYIRTSAISISDPFSWRQRNQSKERRILQPLEKTITKHNIYPLFLDFFDRFFFAFYMCVVGKKYILARVRLTRIV